MVSADLPPCLLSALPTKFLSVPIDVEVCGLVWEVEQFYIVPSGAVALWIAYVGLRKPPPPMAWKVLSRWR